MSYTKKQQHYINIFMQHVDIIIALLNTSQPTSLDTALEAANNVVNSASAVMGAATTLLSVAGIAAAVPTAGLSLPAAGAGITALQVGSSGYKFVKNVIYGTEDNALSSDKITAEDKLLDVIILCREIACNAAATRYRYMIEEIATEQGVADFARYGASRSIKEIYPLIEQLPTAEVVLNYLYASSVKPKQKMAVEEQYCAAPLLDLDYYVKLAYARPRAVSLALTGTGIKAIFYASAKEVRGPQAKIWHDTTMAKYGYMVLPEASLTAYATRHKAVALTSVPELNVIMPQLCFGYVVTRLEVDTYLQYNRLAAVSCSLNAYLSQLHGIKIIAECHDDRLKGLDLSRADFSGVNFRKADLRYCALTASCWHEAHLDGAFFGEARTALQGVIFSKITAEKSTWENVGFLGADFTNALMNGVHCNACSLAGIISINSQWALAEMTNMSLDTTFLTRLAVEERARNQLEQRVTIVEEVVEKVAQQTVLLAQASHQNAAAIDYLAAQLQILKHRQPNVQEKENFIAERANGKSKTQKVLGRVLSPFRLQVVNNLCEILSKNSPRNNRGIVLTLVRALLIDAMVNSIKPTRAVFSETLEQFVEIDEVLKKRIDACLPSMTNQLLAPLLLDRITKIPRVDDIIKSQSLLAIIFSEKANYLFSFDSENSVDIDFSMEMKNACETKLSQLMHAVLTPLAIATIEALRDSAVISGYGITLSMRYKLICHLICGVAIDEESVATIINENSRANLFKAYLVTKLGVVGAATNRLDSLTSGYIRHPIKSSEDSFYKAFDISRIEASIRLETSIQSALTIHSGQNSLRASFVSDMMKIPVEQALLTEELYRYLCHRGAASFSYEQILNDVTLRKQYAADFIVQMAYIQYDIIDMQVDGGWTNPKILQALAYLCDIELRMWVLGDEDVLMPYFFEGEDYSILSTSNKRVDLLLGKDNRLNKLEYVGYENSIPEQGIYPLNSSWSFVDEDILISKPSLQDKKDFMLCFSFVIYELPRYLLQDPSITPKQFKELSADNRVSAQALYDAEKEVIMPSHGEDEKSSTAPVKAGPK